MGDFNTIAFSGNRPLLREITAERLNLILQEIKRNKPVPGRGITTRASGNGISIDLAADLGSGNAPSSVVLQPFDLLVKPAEKTGYYVKVYPGTVSGILPKNWQDVTTCNPKGLYYGKVIISTDGTAVTSVTNELSLTAPTSQAPKVFGLQTKIEYLFGLFSEGHAYRVIGDGHISLTPRVWMTKQKASAAAPGELPWEQYYQLLS